MKTIRTVLCGALVCGFLPSCGPQQTTADKDKQQIEINRKDEENRVKPLIGAYVASLKLKNHNDGTYYTKYILLNIIPTTTATPNTGRGTITEVPTIAGGITMCHDKNENCFVEESSGREGKKQVRVPNPYASQIAAFLAAAFSPESGGTLKMTFSTGSSVAGGGVVSTLTFDGIFTGSEIKGSLFGTGLNIGTVVFTRIE